MKIEESTKKKVRDLALVVRKSKNAVYNDLIEKGLQMTTAYSINDTREKIYNFELELLGKSIVSYAPVEMFKDKNSILFSSTEIEAIRNEFRALDAKQVYHQVVNGEMKLQEIKEYLITKVIAK